MIPVYQSQMLSRIAKWVNNDRTPDTSFFYLIFDLYRRTGGQSGIPFTVGKDLVAAGTLQTNALMLSDDFNEVLTGSGGVMLKALQPGQFQIVYNGIGGNLNVYPSLPNGQIDGITTAYTLANHKTQIYWCAKVLANGGAFCRSIQLG